MSQTTYPYGYGTGRKTMAQMRASYAPRMHPEMWRRLEAWLVAGKGKHGIGSGWRSTAQQTANWLKAPWRFARPGNSFHETQTWASGRKAYAAVDLVTTTSGRHRSPTWAEGESLKSFGLHTFIKGEPWHAQLIHTRSASAWKSAGRKDPGYWPLPGAPPVNPPIIPQPGGNIVQVTVTTVREGDVGGWVEKLQRLLPSFNQDVGNPDGQFGSRTKEGVVNVQNWVKSFLDPSMVVDGICGPQTWTAIFGLAP